MVVLVAGCLERLEAQAAGLQSPFDDLQAVPFTQLVVSGHVICIGMGCEQVGDGEVVPLDGIVEWRQRRAGVDEDARPTVAVGDEIGVGKPVRVHASLEEHRR